MRRLAVTNRGLVALQAVSAGLLMSGYARALLVHAVVALALEGGALIQAVTTLVLWRRRQVSARVAAAAIALVVIVFLQAGLGYRRAYWLHVPVGVGLFGWLTQQAGPPRRGGTRLFERYDSPTPSSGEPLTTSSSG